MSAIHLTIPLPISIEWRIPRSFRKCLLMLGMVGLCAVVQVAKKSRNSILDHSQMHHDNASTEQQMIYENILEVNNQQQIHSSEHDQPDSNHKEEKQLIRGFNRSSYLEKLKLYPTVKLPVHVKEGIGDLPNNILKENLNVEIIPSAKNVTPPNTRLLIYNRVPKCGSTTVYSIIQRMSRRNKFIHRHSEIYQYRWLNTTKRADILMKLYNYEKFRQKFVSFDRHVYYFNVTRLGFPKAAWINFVRDPVSRFVSQFYFVRSRERWQQVKFLKALPVPPEWWFNMTLDDCIEAGRQECYPIPEQEMTQQLTFFCGHHPECRKLGSRWALHRAKRHVEDYYSTVGLLEELPLSLTVMESYLPQYFKNVDTLPLSQGKQVLNARLPEDRRPVSKTTKAIIRSFMKEDIEFYEFVRQRLHLQAKALGLMK